MKTRYRGVVALQLMLAFGPAQSSPFSNSPSLLRQDDCSTWYANDIQQRSRERPGFDKFMQDVECFRFTYLVDGHTVEGHMARPRAAPGQAHPVLVFNRGGNDRDGLNRFPALVAYHVNFAAQGYATISTQYRTADEFGGKDVDDVMALLPIIDGMPGVDKENIGMWGVSRGGMMTYLAAMRSPRFKAIGIVSGVSNLSEEVRRRPEMEQLFRRLMPNYAVDRDAALRARSVIFQMDRFPRTLPVLLIHADADRRVHVSNATDMAAKLAERAQVHRLVVYPGADHDLAPFRDAYRNEVVRWFDQHLRRPGTQAQ